MNRKARAFSLIEIILVLGVISVLLALLFPALSRVRDQGRLLTCESNLRQLRMALESYRQDMNRQLYPWASPNPRWYLEPYDPARYYRPAMELLGAYLETPVPSPGAVVEPSLFICPSDRIGAQWLGVSYGYDLDDWFVTPGLMTWTANSRFMLEHQALMLTRRLDRGRGTAELFTELDVRAHRRIAPTASEGYGFRRITVNGGLQWGSLGDDAARRTPLEQWVADQTR